MKFCDKLAKLRRSNNMSQEQLAELLGVSRQAVSKWESGSSMPDMEKIMQLCKILNCSLDDLVDDAACGNSTKVVEQKININTYLKEVLDFITKTLNMFWSMRLIEKIKCILEMAFIVGAMIVIWFIMGEVIYSIFDGIIYMLPSFLSRLLYNISSIIYNVFGLIIGIIIFIHIFKVRYLDYFVTIEDSNVNKKIIEKPVDEVSIEKDEERKFIEHKKNKIIIRDPKHSTYSFFTMLAHFVVWIIKFILLFVLFFGIISFVILVFCLTFSIWKMLKGVFFIGSAIAIFGFIIVNGNILKIIYNFILDQKNNFKVMFYIFIIGFILIGVGFGISFCSYLTFDKIDNVEDIEYTTYEEVLDINKEKFILDFLDDGRTSIVIDNSRDDIKVEISYNDSGNVYLDYYVNNIYKYNDSVDSENFISYKVYYSNYSDGYDNFVDAVNYLVDKIENKKRIEDYQYNGISKYRVILSQESLNKLRFNETMLYG